MHAAPASLRAELLTRAVTLSNIIDRSSLRWAAKEALPKLCVLLQNSLHQACHQKAYQSQGVQPAPHSHGASAPQQSVRLALALRSRPVRHLCS